MKANSRRRVLISSMCMLLVALVALSTATYAWFTQDTEAKADGVIVRTTKQSSLEISDDSHGYGSYFAYEGVNPTMIPASSLNGANWFKATATIGTNYQSTTASAVTDTEKSAYVYQDQLNILNSGSLNVEDVTITVSGFNGADYLRFALVPVANKSVGEAIPDGTKFADYVYAKDNTAYVPIAQEGAILAEGAEGYDAQTKITPTAVGTGAEFVINLNDIAGEDIVLEPNDDYHLNLYVWFEGQDADCINAKSGQGTTNGQDNTPSGLTFVVSGTDVTE